MARFDEISVGDRAEVQHVITERDLQKFVELTGDDNRLHVDSEYAKRTPFKNRVVHGMLGAAFISTVIGTKLPGDGALWFSQTLEFISPVRLADKITIVATVVEKIARDSVIVLSTEIFNQNKQRVTTGLAKVKIVEQVETESGATESKPQPARRAALVVGATGAVGSAVARRFAAIGYDLVLAYRTNVELAESLGSELSASGARVKLTQGDVTDESYIKELSALCERFSGGLDYIVSTATAPLVTLAVENLDWADFDRHFSANVKSSFLLAKHLSSLMLLRRSPGFVFISSMAAEAPVVGWLPYIAAKSALNGFARALALELAPMGIRSNLVSPGMIDTDLIANVPKKARLMVEAKTPRRRLARPEDVAAAVAHLCSDDCDYVTGETLRVNGGQMML
jgi:3-oxoacyl-[acyl-carrier protein] reductase